MARKVFIWFDYAHDLSRVERIRDLPDVIPKAPAGFKDGSLWDAALSAGDDAVHALVDTALEVTAVTVVCIGSRTAADPHVDYAIERSIMRGNGIVGVRIHAVPDADGRTGSEGSVPALLIENWYKVYTYADQTQLAAWIEEAARDAV
ncbi:MAG TPA: TIR domain-containing protein [Rhodanobacteraceae bacterium]|jgi:hypothetical protein